MGDSTFPAVDVNKELNPGHNKSVQVDPISSDIATTKANKEKEEAECKRKQKEKCEALQSLKKTVLISAIVVAVAGAAIAITKKLREK